MEPPPSSEGNAAVIHALFAELDALGVQEFCVAAGARNAPLLAVLLQTDRKVYHFFEERCAAFFALGRIMMTRRPVAVLTTSGTAVAELFPAVMEAHYQALPLVVVSADRPSAYRGSGAPQAVEQPGLFGCYVSRELDMEYLAGSGLSISDRLASQVGPLHFNVCLEEGAMPSARPAAAPLFTKQDQSITDQHREEWDRFWQAEGDVTVLAGGLHPDDVPLATEFLLKLQAPVVAEATSNLRGVGALSPYLLTGGEKALAAFSGRRVLRVGAVPSWRWWRDLEVRPDIRVLNVSRALFRGLARVENASVVPWKMLSTADIVALPQTPPRSQSQNNLQDLLQNHPHAEPAWMQHLSRVIGSDAVIMLGNSLPIREWNLAADKPQPGTQCFANRGSNGIDGLVSTWLGLSAEAASSWLIVGDLSTLYDLSAPWILPQLGKGRRRIVIINNGGGMIFSRVAWLRGLGEDTRRVLENSHSLSFEPWAKMWNMDYRLITDVRELHDDDSSTAVWEISPDVAETDAFWNGWQKGPPVS